ncbi:MAG: radical SAM protein [Candidatus Eremiobacteraeota bacterium]|nr:radical SAM protein [Candidatus Eremiobacteraeota bacterium]
MEFTSALLIYPHAGKTKTSYHYYPPLGLEIIGTVLEKAGIPVTIVDLRHEETFVPLVKKGNGAMVAVSINWDFELPALSAIIEQVPEENTIIVGGRTATAYVEEIFQQHPRVSCIVRGDGEESIREIAEGKNFEAIDGISFRKNGTVVHNENRNLKAIDNSIIVNRGLRRYDYTNKEIGITVDLISTSRGCPFHCKFCNFNNNPLGQKRNWTGRSPESVVEELMTIDAPVILITDDNFAANVKRVEKICDLIIEKGLKKNFMAAVRLDVGKHPDVLEKMYKAGIRILTIGIESASDRVLKLMNKGFDTAEALKALRTISSYKFFVHGFFMVGYFTETKEEMLRIPQFAAKSRIDTIETFTLMTDKYSPLNTLINDYPDYHVKEIDDIKYIFSDKYEVNDLIDIKDQITMRFYTPWKYVKIIKKLSGMGIIKMHHIINFAVMGIKRAIIPIFYKKKIRKTATDLQAAME